MGLYCVMIVYILQVRDEVVLYYEKLFYRSEMGQYCVMILYFTGQKWSCTVYWLLFYRSEMGLQDYVRQELSRLERQAQNAYTEGEALNCELKAVELQISLVTIYWRKE